jgi:dimethylamine/trimethylamine dehydrogenase
VEIVTSHAVVSVAADAVRAACVFTGRERELPTGAAVFVTARLPQDAIYRTLLERRDRWAAAGLRSVKAVGDCLAPGTIAAAVWEGRRYAEELEQPDDRGDTVPFRREVTGLTDERSEDVTRNG